MAHYVVSDIHGEDDRFHAMLQKINFSKEDTLYILGDVVDRGPHPVELLREIMATPNMKMLLGNHEFMCLRYFAPDALEKYIQHWNRNGNATTLEGFNKLTEQVLDCSVNPLTKLDVSQKPLIFCVLCRPILKSTSMDRTFIWYTDCLLIPSMMKCGFVRTRTLSVRYQIANLSSDIHRYPALYTLKQRLTAAVMRKSALMCRKCVSVANCFPSSTIRSILTLTAAVVTTSRTGGLPVFDWKIWKNFMYKKRGANAPLFLQHKDK